MKKRRGKPYRQEKLQFERQPRRTRRFGLARQQRGARHRRRWSKSQTFIVVFGGLVLVALVMSILVIPAGPPDTETTSQPANTTSPPATTQPATDNTVTPPETDPTTTSATTADSTQPTNPNTPSTSNPEPPTDTTPLWVEPSSVSQPWGNPENPGLFTFRGSPTRTYYGEGPVPQNSPSIAWTYPQEPMCSNSAWQNSQAEWCGTGWTGQPAVVNYRNKTWLIFGAYDQNVHFLDADTGEQLLPPFQTGDIIKGSVTADPDGYPLIYIGSRDNNFRIIAFDRPEPTELWRINAYEHVAEEDLYWNDDWDSSGLVIDDYLFQGGENSHFYIVKLNRAMNNPALNDPAPDSPPASPPASTSATDSPPAGSFPDSRVTVSPEIVAIFPGYDDQLFQDINDKEISIENSPVIFQNTLYFANSGGLVQGWDITGLGEDPDWQPQRTFRFWTGGDVDASLVADEEGMLYVSVERERLGEQYADAIARAEDVGQIIKLNPNDPDDPIVWSVFDLEPLAANPPGLQTQTGLWATPALYGEMLYAATHTGRLLGIDRNTGQICWEINLGGFLWGSPVVIDDILLQGDHRGNLRAYDVSADAGCPTLDSPASTSPPADSSPPATSPPPQIWQRSLGWRIESTPAVWKGSIYLGDRNGHMYALR